MSYARDKHSHHLLTSDWLLFRRANALLQKWHLLLTNSDANQDNQYRPFWGGIYLGFDIPTGIVETTLAAAHDAAATTSPVSALAGGPVTILSPPPPTLPLP